MRNRRPASETYILANRITSSKKCENNLVELTLFLSSPNTINKLSDRSPVRYATGINDGLESLLLESDMFKSEGATLESAHELALALACFTKASSLLKKLCELEEVTPETRLKAQIKREGCLKRARTIYRRMLVDSVQRPQNPPSRKSRKTKQVCTEKRECRYCNRMVFWINNDACSNCDLKLQAGGDKPKSGRVGCETRSSSCQRNQIRPRAPDTSFKDFTRISTRLPAEIDESFVSPRSCAICSTQRRSKSQDRPKSGDTDRRVNVRRTRSRDAVKTRK